MHIKKGGKLYIRIDEKVAGKDRNYQDLQDHLSYVKSIASERYLIGGVFSNSTDAKEGACLFEAENLQEAQEIVQNDPIIARGFYRYNLFEWNLLVLSERGKKRFSENNEKWAPDNNDVFDP